MKRILTLLLAAIMGLSLYACGGGKTPNAGDNSSTQQSEQSHSESIENSDAANTDNTADTDNTTNTENVVNTENPYADHPDFPRIFGQWELPQKDSYLQDEIPCSVLTINEDGTCVVDGVSRVWGFPDGKYLDDYGIGNNLLDIIIYVDEECQLIVRYYCLYEWIGVFPSGYTGVIETSWAKTSFTEE